MGESESKPQVIKKRWLKAILWLIGGTFLFCLLFALAIQIPYVQTKIVKNLSNTITKKIDFPVSIERVNINWFDEIRLEGVNIQDRHGQSMISAASLLIDFEITSLITQENINLDRATLQSSHFNLVKYSEAEDINISLFIKSIKNWTNPDNKPTKRDFLIRQILMENAKVSLNNTVKDSIPEGFDYHHFQLIQLQSEINNFSVKQDTIDLDLAWLEALEPRNNLPIRDFTTKFRFSPKVMIFDNLKLAFGQSEVQDSITFNYNHPSALSFFNDSVRIEAQFRNTVIPAQDLALFVPSIKGQKDQFEISGTFSGRITGFDFYNFDLRFGKTSYLSGSVNFEGLPNIRETFIDANLTKSLINAWDLKPYVDNRVFQQVEKFGNIRFDSQFLGFPRDFVSNGTFDSRLGKLVSDINLKIDDDTNKAIYSGQLSTTNFDLGGLTKRPDLFQKISLNGQIKGSGLTMAKVDFELKATVEKFDFKNYSYHNIVTDARLTKELFAGELAIDDPNLRFRAKGAIDLREGVDHIAVIAELDTAVLKPLHWTDEEASVTSYLDLDITGLEIDNMVGFARFRNTEVNYQGRNLEVDSMEVISQKKLDQRRFHLESNRVRIDANGNYQFTTLFKDLKKLVQEYRLNFDNDQRGLTAYYANKKKETEKPYRIEYNIDLKNANPFLHLLFPQVTVSRNTVVEGEFIHGFTSIFSATSNIDTLQYDNNLLNKVLFDLTTSKISDSTDVLAMAYIFSEQQKLGQFANTQNLSFEAVWDDDHIAFQNRFEARDNPENNADISGQLQFLTDKTEIRFNDSKFRALERNWLMAPDNKITITGKSVEVKSLTLFNQEQSITVNGAISEDPTKKITVEFNRFQVENLNPVLDRPLKGELNAVAEFQSLYEKPLINGGFTISNFTVEDFLVGDLSARANWNYEAKYLKVSLETIRDGMKVVELAGSYTPETEEELDRLNLTGKLQQANLNLLQPFIGQVFSELKGKVNGDLQVSGQLIKPQVEGVLQVTGGAFKVDYLNTTYGFDGNVNFTPGKIAVNNLLLHDENGNQTVVRGGILHRGFKEMRLDLEGDLTKFQVLNTKAEDNNLFYGTAYASGSMKFSGPMNNLTIKANAKSEKGTELFIPISESSDLGESEYINFVSFSDTTQVDVQSNALQRIDLTGVNLDFDFDITTDASMQIIFDLKAGDIIRGRGNGQLNLLVDTEGDFNMFGDFIIATGGYNFTLYNIINKEFDIHSGSKISWYGDPYEGIMDIKASYEQQASVKPLFTEDEQSSGQTDVNRPYPALVLLDLTGRLLSPEINFNIALKDGVNDQEIQRKLNQVTSNETLLKNQVFSLIVLRRFSPIDGNIQLGANAAVSSLSEMLSNQLSYWFSQVDENLEIDVNLNNLDDQALSTFQMRLSYTFLDGRFRVTRESQISEANQSRNELASVIGDWTLEYLLSPDGKFRAKMYNRSNYDALNSNIASTYNTSAGFSVIHTQSFNKLSDLFGKSKKTSTIPAAGETGALLPEETSPGLSDTKKINQK